MAEELRDAADLGLEAPPREPTRAKRWILLGGGASFLLALLLRIDLFPRDVDSSSPEGTAEGPP